MLLAPTLISKCCGLHLSQGIIAYTISQEYMLRNPSLMSIYSALHLSIVNAVYSIYWESMLWTPYLVNAVDSSPFKTLWTSDKDEGEAKID